MLVLDGKIASAAVKASLLEQTTALKAAGKRTPHLAAILVGNNGASETYVASKVKNCEETGFESSLYRFDTDVAEDVLLQQIEAQPHFQKSLYVSLWYAIAQNIRRECLQRKPDGTFAIQIVYKDRLSLP